MGRLGHVRYIFLITSHGYLAFRSVPYICTKSCKSRNITSNSRMIPNSRAPMCTHANNNSRLRTVPKRLKILYESVILAENRKMENRTPPGYSSVLTLLSKQCFSSSPIDRTIEPRSSPRLVCSKS